MLIGKNIHKRYGTVEVLRGVDLDINKGEIVSIVGSSGAEKVLYCIYWVPWIKPIQEK